MRLLKPVMLSQHSQKWMVYALGGGLGHFQRSLSLARAATQFGHQIHIISNSRFLDFIPWKKEIENSGIKVTVIPYNIDRIKTICRVRETLMNDNYDRLIVDIFPRGIAGELPELMEDLKIPKILVSRFLNPVYVKKFNLQNEIKRYRLIISIEKIAPFIDTRFSKMTEPWLLFNDNELYSREKARIHFGLSPKNDNPLIMVCGTGNKEELNFFSGLADELNHKLKNSKVLFNTPLNHPGQKNIWPFLKFINGVDVVIGTGGYNLVHESRLTETQLFAFPQKRLYDNQFLRLTPYECCKGLEELIYKIEKTRFKKVKRSAYENGAVSAMKMIEKLQ